MQKTNLKNKSVVGKPLFVSLLLLSLLVVGCGRSEERLPWPGHVQSINGFSDTEKIQIQKAIQSLNEQAGKTLVSEEVEKTNFTITIHKVSAASWPASRAGFATVNSTECKVEISDMLFNTLKKDYLHPVVWHEIGHCSGLPHSSAEGEIMSSSTSILAAYPAKMIESFIHSVLNSAGM